MANATTETKLEPLDFIAPRDAVVERTTPPGASMPWIPVRLRRGDQVEFRASNDWTLRGWEIPGADVPRVHAELVALRDSADLTRESGGVVCTGESFPDRVLRVARAYGYEPLGVRDGNAGDGRACVQFSGGKEVLAWPSDTDHEIIKRLREHARAENQPEAVRARKARERMASEAKPSKPGAYVDILFNGVKCPTTGPEFVHLTSAAQAAELYGVGSAPHRAMVRAERDGLIVGARDTRTAPIAGTLQPGDVVAHVKPIAWTYPSTVEGMAASRLRDQLASGGVDCPETRATNLARVKAEARVIGEMQDAVREVAGWGKPWHCSDCGSEFGRVEFKKRCVYCEHGWYMAAKRESGPGIAIDRTPGPHEGATAWASPCWEEL